MPFTFAHPAIVLPFIRKQHKLLSATGLIVGSLAPDFESFTRLTDVKTYSHTWAGMFWYDMPMAFAIALVFHVIVRDPLITHLPASLRERFEQYNGMNWLLHLREHFLPIMLSLFLGVFSHLLWDAFTHLNLIDPDSFESRIMLGPIRLYIFLQYACSVIGLVVVWKWIMKMPRVRSAARYKNIFTYWLFVALVSILAFVFIRTTVYSDDFAVNIILLIDICISSFLAALIVVSFFQQFVIGRLKH